MTIEDNKEQFDKVIDFLRGELEGVRTSRATPALVENLKVNIYGVPTPLIQVASISSPEPTQLLIEPWDKNVLKDIEKAIQAASLGLSVANEGSFIRVSMPAMTEETRKEVVKLLNEKLEKNKNSLRGVRDNIKEEIIKAEKEKEISKDEKFSLLDQLDKTTKEYTDKIVEIGKLKEQEIML